MIKIKNENTMCTVKINMHIKQLKSLKKDSVQLPKDRRPS